MVALLSLTNLLDFPIRVFIFPKNDRDITKATSIVLQTQEWEIFKVRPGLDVDQDQTLLMLTESLDLEKIKSAEFNVFEIGKADENCLFWRSTEMKMNHIFEKQNCAERDLSISIQNVRPINAHLPGVTLLLNSSIIPAYVENFVEIDFGDGRETDSSSSSYPESS